MPRDAEHMSAAAVARAVNIIRSFRQRTGESIFAFHAKRTGATSTYLLLPLLLQRREEGERVLLRERDVDATFDALEQTCEETELAEALYRAPFVVVAHSPRAAKPAAVTGAGAEVAESVGGEGNEAAATTAKTETEAVLDYGNACAQRLWRLDWPTLTRTPSARTAAPSATTQAQRQRLLDDTRRRGVSFGYTGARVDSHGSQFTIHDTVVWNTSSGGDGGGGDDDSVGAVDGQAATFAKWTYI